MNIKQDPNRCTGRTTRLLHKVIGYMLTNNNLTHNIIVTAATEHYARDLHHRLHHILKGYECDHLFTFTKNTIDGNKTTVSFMAHSQYTSLEQKLPHSTTVISDHFINYKGR